VWADPASPTGKTPNADADLKESLDRLLRDVDLDKVFYIQVVDAEKMGSPLVKGHPYHVDGNSPRMSWSRNARAYIYETDRGAYLPVEDIARVLIRGLGYKGFVSMELFSRTMAEEGEDVPRQHAQRGIAAWKKFAERLNLN
jgi:4-hydroxyphenylpyruvate dioxygenase